MYNLDILDFIGSVPYFYNYNIVIILWTSFIYWL